MARTKPELRSCRIAFGSGVVGQSELLGSLARSAMGSTLGSLTTRTTSGPRFGIRVGAPKIRTFVIGTMT
jgi:hypothetical protein